MNQHRRYLQQLGLELSERGLPGGRIGQVLAEVDEYVRDSGEDPADTFGAPDVYAEEVAAAAGPRPSAPSAARFLITAITSTAGTLLCVEGVVALLASRSAPLTAGVAATALAVPLLQSSARRLAHLPMPMGLLATLTALIAGLLAEAVVLLWLREPVLAQLPAPALAAAGLGLVVISLRVDRSRTQSTLPEPVADPRPGAGPTDPAVWDDFDRHTFVRALTRGAVVLAAAHIAVLTAVVLLLR